MEIGEKAGQYGFRAKILPVKAVGVQGDNRTYSNAVLIQGKLDYELIEKASTKITNTFPSVNRVIFLLKPGNIETLELEKAFLSRERVERLRECDALAMKTVDEKGLGNEVWQFPVVLLPLNFNGKGEGIVLRPVYSREAMTAKFAKLGPSILEELAEKIMKVKGIGAVMLDVTNKPPATIEWE